MTKKKETIDSILGANPEEFDPALRKAFEVSDSVSDDIKRGANVKIRKDKILLSGDSAFYTLQGEGPTLGQPAVFLRLHVCNLRCTWCLAKGTPITLVNGAKVEIENLEIGDYILASDGKPARVLDSQTTTVTELYEIELENGSIIRCSKDHEFFVEDQWVRAGKLVIGAKLTTTPDTTILLPHGRR